LVVLNCSAIKFGGVHVAPNTIKCDAMISVCWYFGCKCTHCARDDFRLLDVKWVNAHITGVKMNFCNVIVISFIYGNFRNTDTLAQLGFSDFLSAK